MLNAILMAALALVPTFIAAAPPVRIMPAGDSLTAIPYYRENLLRIAAADHMPIELVGPTVDGERGAHAGMSGATIANVRDAMTRNLDLAKPDVVLLMVGTNNMNHGLGINGPQADGYPRDADGRACAPMIAEPLDGSYLNGIGRRWGDSTYGTKYLAGELDAILAQILGHDAHMRVVISAIPPVATGGSAYAANTENCLHRIAEYNALVKAAARRAADRSPGRVSFIDPFTNVRREYGASPPTDFGLEVDQRADWVHPKPGSAVWGNLAAGFYEAFRSQERGAATTRPTTDASISK